MVREQIEAEIGEAFVRVERLFVKDHAVAEQRIGEARQIVVVGDVAVIAGEVVELRLAYVEMERFIRIVADIVGAHVDAVEEAVSGLRRLRMVNSVPSSFGPEPRSTTER